MKPSKFPGNCPAIALGCFALTGFVLFSSNARAIDWTGTTGPFGTGANWGGTVPSATDANIFNGGTATVTGGDVFGVTFLRLGGHSGTGFITQDGGAVTATRILLGGDDAGGGTGQGTYNISGGTLNGTGGEMWIGSKGGIGYLNLSGASTVTNNTWIVIGRDGAAGNVTIAGTSELKNTSQNIGIGVFSTNKSSSVTITGSGKLTSANELYVGWGGNNTNEGTLTVNDSGVVTVAEGLVVGRENAKGTMTVSNNSSVQVNGFLVVGADGSATGNMTINGNSTVNANQMIWVGQNNGNGTLTLNGGTLSGHANNMDATGAGVAFRGSAGTLNLNGGTLETPGFNRVSGTAAINFNGTTIKATGNTNTGSFFNNFGSSSLNVQSGGLGLDTNGNSISVVQDLTGAGGIAKSGGGTLRLTGVSTFGGPSTVSAGTLLNNGTLGSTPVTVSAGAFFGGNGTGTNTVTINAGGTLAAGDGGIGTLTVAAADIDGTLAVEMDGAGSGTIDLLNVTGQLDITNTTVSFTNIGSVLDDAVYVLATYGSLVGSAFASSNAPSGYIIDYAFGGNSIALVAIPEASTAVLGGLGLLAALRRRRR